MNTAIIMDDPSIRQRPTFKGYTKDVAKRADVSEDVAKLFVDLFNNLYRQSLLANCSIRFPGIGTLHQLPESVDGVCLALVPGVTSPAAGRRISQEELLRMAATEINYQMPDETFKDLPSFVKRMWSAHIKTAHHYYRNKGGVSLGKVGVIARVKDNPTWLIDSELHLSVLSRRPHHTN